jgi:hypothetical protein
MTDDKPREFHIIKDQIIHGDLSRDWVSEIDIDPPLLGPNQVHVIEISALNKLNKQLELTKAFLEAALGDCKDAEVAEEMAGNYKKAMDGPRK